MMIDVSPPTVVLDNGFSIQQFHGGIHISLPNGLAATTTEQIVNPHCKQYATKEDLAKILALTVSLFETGVMENG